MLSILIPTYNYNVSPLVKELHKQAQQEGIVFEIIVLDDKSDTSFTEKNREIEILPHCRFLQNDHNLGRTATRKKLAETAQYETLLFLDSDVLPVTQQFIANYLLHADVENTVVFGGYAYLKNHPGDNKMLRYKYGRNREEKTVSERNQVTYGSVFSGNILLGKKIFLDNNYPDESNLYGMDIYFSYMLFVNTVKVLHVDNPIYHLGLEDNDVFFEKALRSVKMRKELLASQPGIENINSLLKHYILLRKYRLSGIVGAFFKLGEPLLRKRILSKNPDLFCMDIYRLGYICSLK